MGVRTAKGMQYEKYVFNVIVIIFKFGNNPLWFSSCRLQKVNGVESFLVGLHKGGLSSTYW